MQELLHHCIMPYDWTAHEVKLNKSLHHFMMPVSTLDLHSVHEGSSVSNAPQQHAWQALNDLQPVQEPLNY